MNLPLFLTSARIIGIPFFLVIDVWPMHNAHIVAACIFSILAVTDWLDGYLARSLKQTTRLGAFLDPVADKLLVVAAVVMVIHTHHSILLALSGVVIIMREIAVSALREWMAELGKRRSMTVTLVSKFKTFLQMLALICLIGYTPNQSPHWVLACNTVLFALSALLTLWTMIVYLRIAWPDLTSSQDQ